MDAETKHQTTDEDTHDLNTPTPHAEYEQPSPPLHNTEWLAPPGPPPTLSRNRTVDVSIGTKTLPVQGDATRCDEEGVAAPRYIPD
jgi:hypothetical protein